MTIRIMESTTYEDGKLHIGVSCLSTDTKPTEGVATGSILLEADTGDLYVFNEDASTWTKL